MPQRRRRSYLLPLVGASVLLMLAPSACTQKTRLTALASLVPFRHLARNAAQLATTGESREDRTENEYLRAQVLKQAEEIARLRGRVEELSGIRQEVKDPKVRLLEAGVVLPADGSPWRKSMTIALGTRGGARKGMLVLHAGHLVGRVAEAGPWTSRVQLVTDPGFNAGAVVVPKTYAAGVPLDKRRVGAYEGAADARGILKWLTGDTPVEPGALVLTTVDPANGVPAGLVLGRVTSASARGAYPKVDVEPAVNFRGLEVVTLLERSE